MPKQTVPNATITQVTDRPGLAVYQDSGATSWVEVHDDGSIHLGPSGSAEWKGYMNSGGTLTPIDDRLHDGDTITISI